MSLLTARMVCLTVPPLEAEAAPATFFVVDRVVVEVVAALLATATLVVAADGEVTATLPVPGRDTGALAAGVTAEALTARGLGCSSSGGAAAAAAAHDQLGIPVHAERHTVQSNDWKQFPRTRQRRSGLAQLHQGGIAHTLLVAAEVTTLAPTPTTPRTATAWATGPRGATLLPPAATAAAAGAGLRGGTTGFELPPPPPPPLNGNRRPGPGVGLAGSASELPPLERVIRPPRVDEGALGATGREPLRAFFALGALAASVARRSRMPRSAALLERAANAARISL